MRYRVKFWVTGEEASVNKKRRRKKEANFSCFKRERV